MRSGDGPYADGPLMMRIALRGNFACVSKPLVAVRIHPGAESASVGSFGGTRYDPLDDMPGILYRQRLQFLDEAQLPQARDGRYRKLAARAYHRETVGRLTLDLAAARRGRRDTLRGLGALGRADHRMLFNRATLKLVATLLGGGRTVKRPRA